MSNKLQLIAYFMEWTRYQLEVLSELLLLACALIFENSYSDPRWCDPVNLLLCPVISDLMPVSLCVHKVVLTVSQMMWCQDMEACLNANDDRFAALQRFEQTNFDVTQLHASFPIIICFRMRFVKTTLVSLAKELLLINFMFLHTCVTCVGSCVCAYSRGLMPWQL